MDERTPPRLHGAPLLVARATALIVSIGVLHHTPDPRRAFAQIARRVKPGGRLAVITFHSVEDRAVKEFGREKSRDYTFSGDVDTPELRQPRAPEMKWVSRKAITPGEIELKENPRSRSAQLRVLEKL